MLGKVVLLLSGGFGDDVILVRGSLLQRMSKGG